MNNVQKYCDVFKRVFNVSEDELNENFTFKNMSIWNSLAHITLISELEFEFDVIFKTEDILHYGSYENGKIILSKYGIDFEE